MAEISGGCASIVLTLLESDNILKDVHQLCQHLRLDVSKGMTPSSEMQFKFST